jgi:tRNA (guanine-N(7)-)-methyltransferase subunit TRM82
MALEPQYPLQCIHYLDTQTPSRQKLLVASAGPKIYSYSADNGVQLSVWPRELGTCNVESPTVAEEYAEADAGGLGSPKKKRRLSPKEKDSVGSPEPMKSTQPRATWSSIPIVIASPTGRHVIAVTAEDKALRVLEVGDDGSLVQVSER